MFILKSGPFQIPGVLTLGWEMYILDTGYASGTQEKGSAEVSTGNAKAYGKRLG
jgi:hypothetical protein